MKTKLIDLKAELAVAQDNVQLYEHIKSEALKAFTLYPNADREMIINSLCEHNDMKREEFDLVCNTEKQCYIDSFTKENKE